MLIWTTVLLEYCILFVLYGGIRSEIFRICTVNFGLRLVRKICNAEKENDGSEGKEVSIRE
jgi:hypothetical protein